MEDLPIQLQPFAPMTTLGAIVLCGGKSERMGRDKATLPFGKQSLLQCVVGSLAEIITPSAIVVVSAPEQDLPTLPAEVRKTHDSITGRGPLEGIAAGMRALPSTVNAVYACSCDAPFVSHAMIKHLLSHLGDHDAVVPFDDRGLYPLCGVYQRRVASSVERQLAHHVFRLQTMLEMLSIYRIATQDLKKYDPDLRFLLNINYPNDYEKALSMLDTGPREPT